MARHPKPITTISLTLRPRITLAPSVIVRAQNAAQAVVDAAISEVVLNDLIAKVGIKPTSTKGNKLTPTGKLRKRHRVVLNGERRQQAIAMFESGATAAAVAKKFDISIATSNNIKRDAGLTQSRVVRGKRRP